MVVSFLLVNGRVLGVVVGGSGGAGLRAGPIFRAVHPWQGLPAIMAAVSAAVTRRHSAVWHLVKARPMS
jgi:hypothetical protein